MTRLCLCALALTFTSFGARGVMPMQPELEAKLRAEGRYELITSQLQAARARGVFNPTSLNVSGSDAGKRATQWRAVVILFDFNDLRATGNYGPVEFQSLLFSQGTHQTGSMKDFYLENSYGDFVLNGDVFGWYTIPDSSAATPSKPSSRRAMATNSARLCPAMLTIIGVPSPARYGKWCAMNASMPSLSKPIELSMPAGVSTVRQGALPIRGSGVIVLGRMAPRRARSTMPSISRA